ncbi:UvrD-helicase domain-containing protein [Propionibacterium australiense]|uniref:DNA 3'-5' helicase n=1 Tax=Propionibacterium australiense TaxID=119981 RepID=A0A383S8E7_9ACTN|nr:ATP-dependent helicase [Propionibacterium australiense]RLP09503.1 ATP-dependent helicase [Propionibacterium australiense]RLP09918.1 ATP-dependent helicase [Propionibacterium australiense]SYZ33832.1 UvrD-like helicase C-terminal domain [Propionibacterium australiense]VEH91981.1 Putative ATP-dependent DNA helicase yjcD [Propionibacterium australiense]
MSEYVLSQEQLEAVTSDASHLMIIAPPGCGKTEVLAHRAAHLIDSLEKNQRVLVLTFTNRARSNLEERLLTVLGQVRTQRHVVVRNFHGFAAHVVLAHGRTIGLEMDSLQQPKTSTVRRALVEAGGNGTEIYEAERMLSEIKRHPFSDEEVLDALRRQPSGVVRRLAETVERARQRANQLHYDDLLRHAQCLLHIPAVARLYQTHFGAVLVDEFHDLSLQQLDLARLSCTSQQTFAGDPIQGIYSWAGAAPAKVKAEILKDCDKMIRLRESYRSSPKVLETVNSIGEQVDPESGLISAQPVRWLGGGCSATLVLKDRVQEAKTLSRLATQIIGSDPDASIGIICRAGWRREDLDRAFAVESGFPVRRWDLAIDDPKIVTLIQSTIATLPHGVGIEDARLAVLNKVDPADVEARENIDDAFDALEQSGATTARAAIRSVRVSDPKRSIGPGVHLLNAHTGKGQQFDWVFVIGLEEGHLPGRRNSQGEALSEERRVLLVMLSRARHGLVVTRVQMNSGSYGLFEAKASRWWSELKTDFSSISEIEAYVSQLRSSVTK